MSVVSPPVRQPGCPVRTTGWDRKHSVCHAVGGRRVWFGLETIAEVERLRSVAIHYGES